MIDAWGEDWTAGAAVSLQRWASPITEVSLPALRLAMAAERIFSEDVIFDLLTLFTLVEDPGQDPWWSAVPAADYAVHVRDLYVPGAQQPEASRNQADLVLTAGEAGFGMWSLLREVWARRPVPDLQAVLASLPDLLLERGWTTS